MPLSDISQVYEDFLLDSPFDMSPPVPELPRRLGRGTISHKCKGYRREEVTFTPDAFENTVVVFREPSLNEKCVLCGTLITIEESLLASPRILAGSGLPVKVKVKVHFHEDIFIIHVSRVIEYDELVKKVGRKIRLSGLRRGDGPIHVKYRDEGGDMIPLGTTEDVQMAFEQCQPGRHLTLFVT
ncbi:PB1 domain-containing protein [Rhodocollybia butyracea]|uniref:PB1 domain-containing protein n=1 Tax=Rhodocollybia butyracea TaxID=206335 RepID=A0A9P5PNH1_9AGAR|nr:PB1 domain-containing protein [Rhodocollybia butyracea]